MMTTTVLRGGLRTDLPRVKLAKLAKLGRATTTASGGVGHPAPLRNGPQGFLSVQRRTLDALRTPIFLRAVQRSPDSSQGALIDADNALEDLKTTGSRAAPGFMKPEGIIVYHSAARMYFKMTIEKDYRVEGETEVNGEHKTPSAHGTEERRVTGPCAATLPTELPRRP